MRLLSLLLTYYRFFPSHSYQVSQFFYYQELSIQVLSMLLITSTIRYIDNIDQDKSQFLILYIKR